MYLLKLLSIILFPILVLSGCVDGEKKLMILSENTCGDLDSCLELDFERIYGVDVLMLQKEVSDTIITLEFTHLTNLTRQNYIARKLVEVESIKSIEEEVNIRNWHIIQRYDTSALVLDIDTNSLFIISQEKGTTSFIYFPKRN